MITMFNGGSAGTTRLSSGKSERASRIGIYRYVKVYMAKQVYGLLHVQSPVFILWKLMYYFNKIFLLSIESQSVLCLYFIEVSLLFRIDFTLWNIMECLHPFFLICTSSFFINELNFNIEYENFYWDFNESFYKHILKKS